MLLCNPASLSSWGVDKEKQNQILPGSLMSLPFSLLSHLVVKPWEPGDIYLLCLLCFRVWFGFFNCHYLLLISGASVTPACGSGKRKQAFCPFEDRWGSPHTQCCIGLFAFCFPILIGWNGWCWVPTNVCLLGNSYISSPGEFSFGKWSTHQNRRWLVHFVSWLPSHLPLPPCFFSPLLESLGKEPFVFYSGKLHWNSSVLYSSALVCAIHGQLWVM